VRALPRVLLRAAVTAVTAASLAVPAAATDPAHDPQVSCQFERQNGVLVYAGVATVPASHARDVVAFTLTCAFVNASGQQGASTTLSTPVVAVAGSGLLPAGPMQVCSYARVEYEDGHTVTLPYTCTPA